VSKKDLHIYKYARTIKKNKGLALISQSSVGQAHAVLLKNVSFLRPSWVGRNSSSDIQKYLRIQQHGSGCHTYKVGMAGEFKAARKSDATRGSNGADREHDVHVECIN